MGMPDYYIVVVGWNSDLLISWTRHLFLLLLGDLLDLVLGVLDVLLLLRQLGLGVVVSVSVRVWASND